MNPASQSVTGHSHQSRARTAGVATEPTRWVGGRRVVAQELRAACKEMYKSIARHHLVASDDAITCVQTAAKAASRAVRLANKAAVEEFPLDFLARFLAFQQALDEVHEVRLIVRNTRVRLVHSSALVWGSVSRILSLAEWS